MALLNYFKKSSFLPNPNEPLSEQMLSSSIVLANRDAQNLLNDETLDLKYANTQSILSMKELK